ncbi:RNA polymerase sigma factor [Occallatibacter savannae]|uniref:RNA polymerase sigma factor n=1 Tax=Occallatibacter savannae TaxID=1002691 RepID=UPI000D692340|nr:sigma-70 family RNA polymerase sigma factor [Occallatibacter savannae]
MASPEDLYEEAVRSHGAALDRLSRAYEADPDKRRDLLQDIHIALWRSFENYAGRCSLRTWVYRVAHNVATSHVVSDRRMRSRPLVSIEDIDIADLASASDRALERNLALEKLTGLIRELKPLDRQLVLLFLEGFDSSSIAEITGLSPSNVATRIHRIKILLTAKFQSGGKS